MFFSVGMSDGSWHGDVTMHNAIPEGRINLWISNQSNKVSLSTKHREMTKKLCQNS